MAERWDGTSWSVQSVPVPPGGPFSALEGVSCTSASACMAVGATFDAINGNSLGTVAERWNGTTWSLVPSPGSANANYNLFGVSCTSASACTAVGNTDSGVLAERWDGTSWTEQSAITPPNTNANGNVDSLTGVSCASPNTCTATGDVFTNSGPLTIAERWDGTTWSVQDTPTPPGTYDLDPFFVSCQTSSVCTAVGGYANNGAHATLAEQWNGSGAGTSSSTTATTHSPGSGFQAFNSQPDRPRPISALADAFLGLRHPKGR